MDPWQDNKAIFQVADGSGFFISSGGYALTAYHVLPEGTGDGDVISGKVAGKPTEFRYHQCDGDQGRDIALLKLITGGVNCKYLRLAPRDRRASGTLVEKRDFWKSQSVWVSGWPHGAALTPQLSHIDSASPVTHDENNIERLKIDWSHWGEYRGMSGGPIFLADTRQVVGVVGGGADYSLLASDLLQDGIDWPPAVSELFPDLNERDQQIADGVLHEVRDRAGGAVGVEIIALEATVAVYVIERLVSDGFRDVAIDLIISSYDQPEYTRGQQRVQHNLHGLCHHLGDCEFREKMDKRGISLQVWSAPLLPVIHGICVDREWVALGLGAWESYPEFVVPQLTCHGLDTDFEILESPHHQLKTFNNWICTAKELGEVIANSTLGYDGLSQQN